MALEDEEIEELLDKREELEDTAKELTFKIRDLEKNIKVSGKEVMKRFKTTNSVKLKVKRKKLVADLSTQVKKLENNPLYQEMMES